MNAPLQVVRDDASLHESTVKDAAKHVKRKRRKKPTSRNGRITAGQVDKRIMQAARLLADGDRSRIQILSVTEVVVLNPGVRRK